MAGVNLELLLKVRADAAGVAATMAPMVLALEKARKETDKLERELNKLDGKNVNLNFQGDAIQKLRTEIRRIQTSLARQIKIDPNVDISKAQAQIKKLEAKLRLLENKDYRARIAAVANEEGARKLQADLEKQVADAMAAVQRGKELAEGFTVPVDARLKKGRKAELTAELELLKLRLEHQLVLGVDIDIDQTKKRMAEVQAALGAIGSSVFKSVAEAGTQVGNDFVRLASKAIVANPEIAAAFAAVAAFAAEAFFLAFGSAVLLAGGLSGIAVGIIAALQDPAILETAKATGQELLAALQPIGDAFRQPLLDSFQILVDAFEGFVATIGPGMNSLAEPLVGLANAVAAVLAIIGPAFNELLLNSGPMINTFAKGLIAISAALADTFKIVAHNQDAFIGFFIAVIGVVKILIDMFNVLLFVVAKNPVFIAMGKLAKALGVTSEATGDATAGFGQLKESTAKAADGTEALTKAQKAAAKTAKELFDRMEQLREQAVKTADKLHDLFDTRFGIRMDAQQAAVSWAKGLRELNEELKKGTRTLSLNTEEGIKNQSVILDQIQNAKRMRDVQIAQGKSIADANRNFTNNVKAVRDVALALGFNAKQVKKLTDAYLTLPKEVETEIKAAINKDDFGFVAAKLLALGEPVEKLIKPEWWESPEFVLALAQAGGDVTKLVKPEWLEDENFKTAIEKAGLPLEVEAKLLLQNSEDLRLYKKMAGLDGTKPKLTTELFASILSGGEGLSPAAKKVQGELDDISKKVVTPHVTLDWVSGSPDNILNQLNAIVNKQWIATISVLTDSRLYNEFIHQMDLATQDRTVRVIPYVDQEAAGRVSYQLSHLSDVGGKTGGSGGSGGSGGGTTGGMQPNSYTPPKSNTNAVPAVNVFVRDKKLSELIDVELQNTTASATKTVAARRIVSI